MVIDFQSHVYPEAYIEALQRADGNVILEPPDPYSGMSYFYDKGLKWRINTATFQGRDPDRRIAHMDRLGIDIQGLSIPPPRAGPLEEEAAAEGGRGGDE